ncbi:MAG: endonuclease/exonuclease/phosphatase family protein [Ferruginibacter sp.]
MRKIILSIILNWLVMVSFSQQLNVMTFNIRLNTSSDSLNAWPYRKDLVASQVLFHDIKILGVQEALHDQMQDLQERLPTYKFCGGARDDGKTKGEYSAVFYDTTRFAVLATETFWLSETPAIPGSKSWDAAITRICTWVKFKDLQTKKIFFVFNTHFDHIGKMARKESAALIQRKVYAIAKNTPVIIMGDFNSTPESDAYQLLADKNDPKHFTDAKEISQSPHYGPAGTFNGFRSKERDDKPIDFIFLKGKWKVLKHASISQTWQGRFASDHFAVMAILKQF